MEFYIYEVTMSEVSVSYLTSEDQSGFTSQQHIEHLIEQCGITPPPPGSFKLDITWYYKNKWCHVGTIYSQWVP